MTEKKPTTARMGPVAPCKPLFTDEQRSRIKHMFEPGATSHMVNDDLASRNSLRQAFGLDPLPLLTWRTMARRRRGGVELRAHLRQLAVYLEPRDWWIGYYRGTSHHYVCVLPCLVIRWNRR